MNNRALCLGPAEPGMERTLHRSGYRRGQALAMPINGPDQPVRLVTRATSDEGAPPAQRQSVEYETMFVSNLETIERVVRHVCQRQKLSGPAAEEFDSEVKVRLMERDYEVFRKFQHRSSLRTYLTVVIQRIYLDYRNHLWGKWRPSAEARRLGPVAIRLGTLIARGGYSFEQAAEHLRTNENIVATDADLNAFLVRLPIRTRRAMVSEEELDAMPDNSVSLDDGIFSGQRRADARRVLDALTAAMQSLEVQDRVILRLRFHDGFAVADIARALHLDQKPLYRRFDALLQRLRTAIESAGISRLEAVELVNRKDVDISLALLDVTSEAQGSGTHQVDARGSYGTDISS